MALVPPPGFLPGEMREVSLGPAGGVSEWSSRPCFAFPPAEANQAVRPENRSAPRVLESAVMSADAFETARRLRYVAPAGFMKLLDVLQAHAGRRHGMRWRLSFAALRR